MKRAILALYVVAGAAVALRLFAMTFLHPLNWDEVEYFRATDWVRQGLVPFRDFWEHHTPLQWFVFAPITALTDSPGVAAIILLRWAQLPLWLMAFWLINRLMQRAGLDPFARWTAMALALTSSLLMLPAMEYRVDTLANVLYLGALWLAMPSPRFGDTPHPAFGHPLPASGERALMAGVLLTLAGFANLRLAPLLAITLLVSRSPRVFAGAIITSLSGLLYFVATDSLQALYQHVWLDNYIGESLAERVPYAFLHRILVPFGLGIYGGGASVPDVAGAAILIVGAAGLVRALRDWRDRGPLFILAILQIVNLLFIARMKFVYHYHLQIVVLLMLPFVASAVQAVPWRRTVLAFVVAALAITIPIVLLRGKELDLQYQDRIMREVHARTAADAKVFDGVGWAIRREPAYRFWFLPVLARQLVAAGHAPRYTVAEWIADPPAAVITDRNATVWLAMDRPLGSYVVRHYLPLWRDLLMPAMSARIEAGGTAEWIVPASGRYRVMAGADLAAHPWFRIPLARVPELHRPLKVVPRGAALLGLSQSTLDLKRGSRLSLRSRAAEPLGVFLVPGDEPVWFRQPPPGVTIDAELPRVWHMPFSECGGLPPL
ncbi:MAG TPA: hypothetical protein VM779_08075 [Thermoanaerobaculia bacterium]|nr:hypothetical protein [Thermoanaerobaculia bacterium]